MSLVLSRISHVPGCQLWLADLDQPCGEALRATLTPDETARAARFVFETDRRRFVTARCALRQVLSMQTGTPAAALRFDYGPSGKPTLAAHPDCVFNLSHSGGTALIGVLPPATGAHGAHWVGVDIEQLRGMPGMQSIADMSFHADDAARLGDQPDPALAFLHGWTRREACLKALGLGLPELTELPATGLGHEPLNFVLSRADGDFSLGVSSFRIGADLVGSLALGARLHSRLPMEARR
ncbi:4'-phosphopantetheinyl transferase superfamily protein [Variovorax sp. J22P168]|uniref:4'-phosphopantetheinyl transferase family protein n=1 Tax=Variovorax jilinensis TaxID=3053513 RepID=UPI0025759952|nr:4'-phosphopantetheinyl transferase superfamily protein [Variovorax sp. J22P168]MDM0011239.1 4'-phosphopantetheinyl transferase superfamily protein [Variovorax sp. J22P168]